jgi:PAS domain S-box-containing protein
LSLLDAQLRLQAEALEQVVRERKESLHASVERFRLLVAGVKDYAIIMLDADGQIISWNTGAERITGYAAEAIIGQHVARLYGAADVAAGKPERELHGAAAHGRYEDQGWRVRQDGSRYWAHVVVTALHDEAGKLRGFAKVSRDITEAKRAEEAMRATTAELARSNAELEQFAYVASHDLQEPLRAVSGMVQLLRQRYAGQLDARADEYIQHAVDGATRMQTLINDLLAYARIGTRGQPLSVVDSASVVADTLRNLAVAIQDSAAVITVDDLPTVLADRSQLTQLFQNLIGNALKYRGDEPPTVEITAERLSHAWCFSVVDNGIGIEPAYGDRIFNMFQRLHGRDEYSGTGIGLAICKRVVDLHGGNIWVEPATDGGSTFRFTLPLRLQTKDVSRAVD